MDKKEFDELVRQLRKSGLTDDKIMRVLVETYESKNCDITDLEVMVSWLGYLLTDDFYKDHKIRKKH